MIWDFKQQDWLDEVKKSLKDGIPADFVKTVFSDKKIHPFSRMDEKFNYQLSTQEKKPFVAIQNYSDLKSSGLEEWLADKDIGFRFRDLNDLLGSAGIKGRPSRAYLSQPFAFKLSQEQSQFIEQFVKDGSCLNLGWSPLSFGLTRGEILKKPFYGWENIFSDPVLEQKNVKWFYLSSAPYQWAGAEPHLELAIVLSMALAIFEELQTLQVSPEVAAQKITFGLSLGTDVLVESSKIVAMKLLWQRVVEMGGVAGATPEVYGLPSLRVFAGRDPWNNIMRTSLMSFSALVGGADGFKCIPYDVLNKRHTADAIRVSTNIPLVLKKEGFMDLVQNQMDGGSLFAQTIDLLCKEAWTIFQEIERKGGVFEAVRSGWLQAEMRRSAETSKNDLSYLRTELVGINKYISKKSTYGDEVDIVRLGDIIDPVFLTQTPDDYISVEPLVVESLSYDWEILQVNSDHYFAKNGKRPKVCVVKGGGPIVDKKVSWVLNALSLGGTETQTILSADASTFTDWTPLVIIVSSDEDMEQSVTSLLKSQGVEKIWSLAAAKKDSGVDRYIEASSNVLDFIKNVSLVVLGR